MATFQAIFSPTSPVTNVTTFTGTIGAGSTVSVVLAPRTLFAVTVSADSNIRFGNATKAPTATAADLPLWGKTFQEWDMGGEFDRISLFSTAGGSYWVQTLSRT
jgi:hypothetical protein